jgi:hypothetical protein
MELLIYLKLETVEYQIVKSDYCRLLQLLSIEEATTSPSHKVQVIDNQF